MVNYRGISHLDEWDKMSERDRKCNYNILKNYKFLHSIGKSL